MRALVTLLGFGLLALAGCLSNDAPAPDDGPPLACAAGGSACPALAGFTVSCEDGACVARSPTADARADCAGDGRYGNDLRFDARNCGACGVVCPGSATCFDGACACAPSEVRCNGVCVSTATSRAHCGGCGRACAAGERCVAGACVACPAGESLCGDRCVPLAADGANCGACGRSCGGTPCVDGVCAACPADRVTCGADCANLNYDSRHCGRCGARCALGLRCLGGSCVPLAPSGPSCPSGTVYCDYECRDLRTDSLRCGSCDNVCPAGAPCRDGRCVIPCPAGTIECAGTCYEVQASVLHCGSCDNACPAGAECRDGRCACPEGFEVCGGRCADQASDHAHCGGCGRACGPAEACVRGRCEACLGGGRFCPRADACVDLATTDAHCGACDAACRPDLQCRAGRCVERCDAFTSRTHSDVNCGTCGVECGAGTLCVDGRCASASPRLKAPISAAFVTSARPWFRWELPAGADGARVEVCATRACDRVEASWEAVGDRLRAPTALAPGVHHWRAYARRGGRFDAAPSLVWEFIVPGVAGLEWGAFADLNGDGAGDTFTTVSGVCASGASCIEVRYGRPPTGAPPGVQRLPGPVATMTSKDNTYPTLLGGQFIPDVNGDGFGELLTTTNYLRISSPGLRMWQSTRIHLGSSAGVFGPGAGFSGLTFSDGLDSGAPLVLPVGDRNGDGYGDTAVWAGSHAILRVSYAEHLGGRLREGFGTTGSGSTAPMGVVAGDFNADGRSDLVYWYQYGRGRVTMGAATFSELPAGDEVVECPRLPYDPFLRFSVGFVAGVADVNDDGYDDLTFTTVAGPSVTSRMLGGPDGLSSTRCTPLP